MDRVQKGEYGESLALEYLEQNGFRILENRFRTQFGELDIIAVKERKIYFIEVKYRHRDDPDFDSLYTMHQKKINRMRKVATQYLDKNNSLPSMDLSFCLIKVDSKGKVDFYSDL